MSIANRPENARMKTVAIIPAAGAGVRMEMDRAKQFLDLDGRPLLALTLEKFQESPSIDSIILIVPSDSLDFCKSEIIERQHLNKVRKVVAGGKRRQDSVRLGIEATEGKYDLILIHDGVRPLIESRLIEEVVSAARKDRAVITALPAKDTVKKINGDHMVIKTCNREHVWLVQTPQVFRYDDIMKAHRLAIEEGWEEMTDDALLVERMGIPVNVIMGSEDNIKITTPHDMELANFLLNRDRRT